MSCFATCDTTASDLRVKQLAAVQIRLYRVRWFFEHLEYNLTLSLLWVTLVRNLVVGILSTLPALLCKLDSPKAPCSWGF